MGTDTIHVIPRDKVPHNKRPTYACFVTAVRLQKKETHRTRITVGGNSINYPGNVKTPTADIETAKLLFNS
eukprot:10160959-Ditylum_brightwellii.AAC.1